MMNLELLLLPVIPAFLFLLLLRFLATIFGIRQLLMITKSEILELFLFVVAIIFFLPLLEESVKLFVCFYLEYYGIACGSVTMDELYNQISTKILTPTATLLVAFQWPMTNLAKASAISYFYAIPISLDRVFSSVSYQPPTIKKPWQGFTQAVGYGSSQMNEYVKNAVSNTFSIAPCSGYQLIQAILIVFFQTITSFRGMFMGFLNLLQVAPALYVVFMSIGIFLRCFVVTRQIGGFFISFAISMLLLLPISYFIFMYFLKDINMNDSVDDVINQYAAFVNVDEECLSIDFGKIETFSNLLTQDLLSFGPGVRLLTAMLIINLIMGLSLLTILSVTVGLSKIFGTEIYPWVLSNILRLR